MVRTNGSQPLNLGSQPRQADPPAGGDSPMFYTYILQSAKDDSTYIGSTEDLRLRLKEHNQGKTKSIKHKIPYRLLYYEAYGTKMQARKREIELKTNGSEKRKVFARILYTEQMPPSSNG